MEKTSNDQHIDSEKIFKRSRFVKNGVRFEATLQFTPNPNGDGSFESEDDSHQNEINRITAYSEALEIREKTELKMALIGSVVATALGLIGFICAIVSLVR